MCLRVNVLGMANTRRIHNEIIYTVDFNKFYMAERDHHGPRPCKFPTFSASDSRRKLRINDGVTENRTKCLDYILSRCMEFRRAG